MQLANIYWMVRTVSHMSLLLNMLAYISEALTYQIRYAEENQRSTEVPWSVRQTGVYHFQSKKTEFDLFIFLHPLKGSIVENQLTGLARIGKANSSLLDSIFHDPYRLHILLFSSYLNNWRWYFRYLGENFQKKVCTYCLLQRKAISVLTLEKNDEALTLDLSSKGAISLNFDMVQSLHDLHDIILTLGAFCEGSLGVIETLENIGGSHYEGTHSLRPFSVQLGGNLKSLSVLGNRVRNAIDLVRLHLKKIYSHAS